MNMGALYKDFTVRDYGESDPSFCIDRVLNRRTSLSPSDSRAVSDRGSTFSPWKEFFALYLTVMFQQVLVYTGNTHFCCMYGGGKVEALYMTLLTQLCP